MASEQNVLQLTEVQVCCLRSVVERKMRISSADYGVASMVRFFSSMIVTDSSICHGLTAPKKH